MSNELNLDELEALARAATPGPWRASQNSVFAGPRYRVVPRVTAGGSSQGMIDDLKWEKANAAHIAAANPAVVLQLISMARRATHASQQGEEDARNAALEEAASLCESDDQEYEIGRRCASAIRKLKSGAARAAHPGKEEGGKA